jgi:hypothetical protein
MTMVPPKNSSSAVVLHAVPRTKTPVKMSAAPAKSVSHKQRLRMASKKMDELDAELKDTVAGLKRGSVDFSDFDPD